jgi:hypothetical protein
MESEAANAVSDIHPRPLTGPVRFVPVLRNRGDSINHRVLAWLIRLVKEISRTNTLDKFPSNFRPDSDHAESGLFVFGEDCDPRFERAQWHAPWGRSVQQIATTIDGTLRYLRIFHGALFIAVFAYAFLMFWLPNGGGSPLDRVFFRSVAVMCVAIACVAFWYRAKLLGPAFEKLRSQSDAPDALANWRKGVITSATLAESIALFGLAIHLLGGTNAQAIPFFVVGAVLIVIWWPERP